MPTKRIDEEQAWQQVVIREEAADFFYAVTTTGVFCRPSCTSRRPLRRTCGFSRQPRLRRLRGSGPASAASPLRGADLWTWFVGTLKRILIGR